MEVATSICFIEHSVQFEEYQLYGTPRSTTQEGITISPPFFDDDDFLQVLDSDEEDQIQHEPVIDNESHDILDPELVSIPNHKPKPGWS